MEATVDGTRPKLCILTKPLVPGHNKTRLIPKLGAHKVADLTRAFLLDTYRGALGLERADVVVALSESGPLPALAPAPTLWEQGPGDLGERMCRVARRALREGAPWVILLGGDSPGLPRALLMEAVHALETNHDAVLGPADDGGYYLIGLRRCPQGLLSKLPWSSEHTLEKTVARLRAFELEPYLTRPWFDIDRPSDLERLERELLLGNVDAPQTRRVLWGTDRS